MEIKKFLDQYNNMATETLKNNFFEANVQVKTYIRFLTKTIVADKLAKITTIDKETGNVNVKSDINYLLFCRMIIEQYTDLQIETDGFYEEYDLLNESGLLDKIMQMIPEKEINEFKMLCDFKQKDILTNQYEIHSYISNQVTRFGELIGITLKPIMEKISEQIENMDDKTIENFGNKLGKFFKRIK